MKKTLILASALLTLASCSDDDNKIPAPEAISEGAILSPAIGGPTQPNQVYLDLSSESSTSVNRTTWDLGFYSGSEFRVVLNSSVKMAAKQTESTDITQPVAIDNAVSVGSPGGPTGIENGNVAYVDAPAGNLSGTAIAEVSATDANNKVYLVNLGNAIPTTAPAIGSVNTYGEARGWKKIRVLRSGNGYKLQYANPEATTFQEVTINKDAAYNFKFFSLVNNAEVVAEPQKDKWDLKFTTFTSTLNGGPQLGTVSYFYSDFVITNVKGGTRAYEVLNSAGVTYDAFTTANVDQSKFSAEAATDQRAIGANWRNSGGPSSLPSVKDDRFYVVKDVAGNVYKVKFIALYNAAGERGYPTLQYTLLQ